MGSNEEGKLGVGLSHAELPYSKSPRLVEGVSGIQFIAAGHNHSLVVGHKSELYGWGEA